MNRKKAKKIAAAAVSCVLGAAMCFSVTACSNNPETNNPTVDYYKEGTVSANGTKSGNISANGKFYTDYATLDEVREAGKELNIKLAEEGNVLLKNDDCLPLGKEERWVSLFGYRTINLQTGGGGAGAGNPGVYGVPMSTLPESMMDAGFNVNPKLIDMYQKYLDRGNNSEISVSAYNSAIVATYAGYDGAAIVTLSRTGSEGEDLKTHDVAGHADTKDHYLQLNDNEVALIKHVKQHFKKVVVLINSSNIMEVGELAAEKTPDNLGVDAIMWIGHVGNDGAAAIGKLLSGEVNPSGHTVDIWPEDFKKDPTWTNFGDNSQMGLDINLYVGDEKTNYHSIEYREDIYNGYRYYETVADDKNATEAGTGESWYKENVTYPFGHGLSYTTFDWKITEDIARRATIDNAHSTVTLKVEVTNTGKVAGKDVVQVYYSAPYTNGGIEKASANLVDFAKTDLLEPGETQTLTLQFVAQDMASFDYDDANFNGFKGYELEAGDYNISIRKNSHEVVDSVTRTVEEGINCTTDYISGNEITPVFSGGGKLDRYISTNDTLLENKLSRANDLTQLPAANSKADRTVSASYKAMLDAEDTYYGYQDTASDPWYVSSVPTGWTQATAAQAEARTNGKTAIQLADMSGVTYTEANIDASGKATAATDEGSKKWEQFMNQLTYDELYTIVTHGRYGQASMPSIGKDFHSDLDGSSQIAFIGNSMNEESAADPSKGVSGMGTNWVTAVVQAATFNVDLCEDVGRIVGNESLFLNCPGWYGPSMNIHRSPFSGRNYEYYSQDGVQGGMIAAAVVKGATSKGVHCYIKHMFLNDQETERESVSTWATEQAIREIYAKPFEMAIKLGGSTGTMTAFNRIGDAMASTNYAMLESLMRQEWGFTGHNVTDSWDRGYRPMNLMLRTGQDLPLGKGYEDKNMLEEGKWDEANNTVLIKANENATEATVASPTQYYAIRKSAQRILYVNANDNNMANNIQKDVVINLELVRGVENNTVIPIDVEKFGSSEYQVIATGLPEGLEIKGDTITGKIDEAVELDIKIKADHWVTVNGKLNITVCSALKFGDVTFDKANCPLASLTAGTAVNGKITSDFFYEGKYLGEMSGGVLQYGPCSDMFGGSGASFKGITYTATGLPEGLTLNWDGTISGTPTTAGTYEVTINMIAPHALVFGWGSILAGMDQYTQTITITVA